MALPVDVPPVGSTPASASPNNVNGGGSSVDGPVVTSLALSGTPADPNQPIQIRAQQTPVTLERGDVTPGVASPPSGTVAAEGTPSDVNQTVGLGPIQNQLRQVDGGNFNPTSANVVNTTQNNVAGQVLGTGTPRNVFV